MEQEGLTEQHIVATTPHRAVPYLVLLGGVLMAATSAILIAFAQRAGAPSLTIAAGRMLLAALILTPFAWQRHSRELRAISRRDGGLALLGGVFLALHLASWITSLSYTSVASSTALVTTNPIFVGLASALLFRERIGTAGVLGILLSVGGSVLVGLSDRGGGSGSNPLLGDALALMGAVTASGYFLVGRTLRKRIAILPYIWLVYSSSALVLLLWLAVAGQTLWGFSPRAYGLILALALGPQLLGHTSFNWAIKYLSATVVAVAILGEPIGSALIALWLLPGQTLQPLQLIGGLVLLSGIAVVTLMPAQKK